MYIIVEVNILCMPSTGRVILELQQYQIGFGVNCIFRDGRSKRNVILYNISEWTLCV
jgi:hypothetical protein